MKIRPARVSDRDQLYEICLLTANRGDDGSLSYPDKKLPGEIWVGPYLTYEPEFAFVAIDSQDLPIGYCVATKDTRAFDNWAEINWWPKINWTPNFSPDDILDTYPSHGHINLLPKARGQGLGRLLIESVENLLRAGGSNGIHMRVDSANQSALAFYQSVGFEVLRQLPGEVIVTKKL